jgi:hypothetical protein
MIPIKDKERTNKDKNRKGKKKGDKINLNIPKIPNFNSRPANNNDIEELPSQ